jgi:hypothetical protein
MLVVTIAWAFTFLVTDKEEFVDYFRKSAIKVCASVSAVNFLLYLVGRYDASVVCERYLSALLVFLFFTACYIYEHTRLLDRWWQIVFGLGVFCVQLYMHFTTGIMDSYTFPDFTISFLCLYYITIYQWCGEPKRYIGSFLKAVVKRR